MAKVKKLAVKTLNKKNSISFSPVRMLFILIIGLCGAFGVALLKQESTIWKYELLEKIDNQACRYLDNQLGVNGSFDLSVNASVDEPKLTYKCTTGETVAAKEIHGKSVARYELGATVSYFSSNEEAEKFAAEKLNPLRYWGVDEEGQRNGIPQTSRFTFIVNDENVPYFDAYTVKANAVLRVSLPCGDPDVKNGGVACYEEANSILDREMKGINVL